MMNQVDRAWHNKLKAKDKEIKKLKEEIEKLKIKSVALEYQKAMQELPLTT